MKKSLLSLRGLFTVQPRWGDRVWVSFRVQISEKRHCHTRRCSWHSRDHTVWTRIYLWRTGGSLHGLKRCSDQLTRSCIWHITPVNHFFPVHKQHLSPLDWCWKFISSLYCLPFPRAVNGSFLSLKCTYKIKWIYNLRNRTLGLYRCCHSTKKKNSLAEFSVNIAC